MISVKQVSAILLLACISMAFSATLHAAPSNDEKKVQTEQEQIYREPDSLAMFPGGTEAAYLYLRSHLKYPEQAQKAKLQGRVQVRFVVEKDGSVSNVEVVRTAHALLDAEAVRVVKSMPKWKPALKDNKPVRSLMNLPILFRCNDCQQSCGRSCKKAQ